MSGPMPSPSIQSRIGWSGTLSLPSRVVMRSPVMGTTIFSYDMGSTFHLTANFRKIGPEVSWIDIELGGPRQYLLEMLLQLEHTESTPV